ncbi:MAG: tRNA pseudouridine(13) synthase TruD [Polyangiaceae bacterium]|nr:tRNA pseudouridine(13) synthase TruD [Polyangiaceae bacterium]
MKNLNIQRQLPKAVIRSAPADFVVEEVAAYPPSGVGEHVYVTFRKTGLTTPEAVKRLAQALGVDPRDAGHAGMKDRHAVTTQTVSLQVPLAVDAEKMLGAASPEAVEILSVARHTNKLKPGHLHGNRFAITLRDLDPSLVNKVIEDLSGIAAKGVPNTFGPQRFGRDGDNASRALAWIRGEARGPRDRNEQRLLFSALQSSWFNEVLDIRENEGTWNRIVPGDLAKKTDTGGIFLVPLSGPETDDAVLRGQTAQLTPTGPMFGKKMRWPEGHPAEIESQVLRAAIGDPALLDAWAHLGEGTRRPLVMPVESLSCELVSPPDGAAPSALIVRFTLPKGGYATTVLSRVVNWTDATVAHKRGEQSAQSVCSDSKNEASG